MARIRTVKPDFWTDEKLTECSMSARLLFIGTWNFADDKGNLQASAKKLKMQIFPADNIDCQPLLDELITHGLLIEYSVNGENYLNIKNFTRHQVINRPSHSDIPQPQITDKPHITHGVITEPSVREGKGREGIKTDGPTGPATPSVQASPENNHKAIIFNLGVSLLTKNGELDQTARSFLGKLAKGGEAKLAEAIGYLAANPKIDPKAYLSAAMKPKERGLVL